MIMKTKSPRTNGPYRHGRRWRVQLTIGLGSKRTTSYKVFDSLSEAADYMGTSIDRMTSESAGLLRRSPLVTSSRGGWVYVVAVAPDVNKKRLKVGFTNSIASRFAQHRTTNPTALLLAAWEATSADETVAHRALKGRIGISEVFLVPNVHDALAVLDGILGPRLQPMDDIGRPIGSAPVLVPKDFATARQRRPRANGRPAIADLVIRDVRARQEIGNKRYGTDLQANNGRDALVDAYQEAIDLAMYLRQLLEERGVTMTTTRPTQED